MAPLTLWPILLAGSLLCLLFALLLQGRNCRSLQRKVRALEEALDRIPAAAVPDVPLPRQNFAADLARAERSAGPPLPHRAEIPDRYRYARAMVREGMGAAQIAATLQIGEAEAAQIMRLVRR